MTVGEWYAHINGPSGRLTRLHLACEEPQRTLVRTIEAANCIRCAHSFLHSLESTLKKHASTRKNLIELAILWYSEPFINLGIAHVGERTSRFRKLHDRVITARNNSAELRAPAVLLWTDWENDLAKLRQLCLGVADRLDALADQMRDSL